MTPSPSRADGHRRVARGLRPAGHAPEGGACGSSSRFIPQEAKMFLFSPSWTREARPFMPAAIESVRWISRRELSTTRARRGVRSSTMPGWLAGLRFHGVLQGPTCPELQPRGGQVVVLLGVVAVHKLEDALADRSRQLAPVGVQVDGADPVAAADKVRAERAAPSQRRRDHPRQVRAARGEEPAGQVACEEHARAGHLGQEAGCCPACGRACGRPGCAGRRPPAPRRRRRTCPPSPACRPTRPPCGPPHGWRCSPRAAGSARSSRRGRRGCAYRGRAARPRRSRPSGAAGR